MFVRPVIHFGLTSLLVLSACGDDKAPVERDRDPINEEQETPPEDEEPGAEQDPDEERPADAARPRADASRADGGAGESPDGRAPQEERDAGEDADEPGPIGTGACCDDGDCLCHGPEPDGLTSEQGPYKTESYALAGAGCVHYPTDAEPPFAAVTISDGLGGTGGCGRFAQTSQWGAFYASWGIVAMIVDTVGSDRPEVRGEKLLVGVEAFKGENEKSGSPLEGKLAGRYGTSGFSMGGGGTTFASRDGDGLRTSVSIMPWGPARSGVEVPTLIICGATDAIASCNSHGTPLYSNIGSSVPKMRVQVSGGHNGQPSAGMGKSGAYGLAFQKVFLEGDERWRPFLVEADSEETNIE